MVIYLPVNERIFEIFSYAFASFLYLRQSPHGTQVTQKNVTRDNHVNKDNSGEKKKLHYNVNRGYFYGNNRSILHQATSSCRAKKGNAGFFLRFLHASDGCECAIVKHVIKWCLYSKVLFTF